MSMNDTHQQVRLCRSDTSRFVAVSLGVAAATVVVFGRRLVNPTKLDRKRWRMVYLATIGLGGLVPQVLGALIAPFTDNWLRVDLRDGQVQSVGR